MKLDILFLDLALSSQVTSGEGAYSGRQTFSLASGDNTYTSDNVHGGVTISDFQVTEGQPLAVRATAGLAIAYLSNISFYGPKSP